MKHWFVKKIKLRIGIFTSGSKLTINRSVNVYDLRLKNVKTVFVNNLMYANYCC